MIRFILKRVGALIKPLAVNRLTKYCIKTPRELYEILAEKT